MIFLVAACKSPLTRQEAVNIPQENRFVALPDTDSIPADWSGENTVVYQWIAEPRMLHPTNGISGQRQEVLLYTQMFLIATDYRTLEPVPGLAGAMPDISSDGLHITFELRDEPRWDDGSALSFDDIRFTALASKCPLVDNPNAKPFWDNLGELVPDAQNPRRFTAVMKTPYIHNVIFWSDWPVMQRTFHDPDNVLGDYTLADFDNAAQEIGNDAPLAAWAERFNSAPYGRDPQYLNGLGPYRVAEWEDGQRLVLERKINHWTAGSTALNEAALPDRIVFVVNRDANSQMLEFRAQNYDASTNISPSTLLSLRDDPAFARNFHGEFSDTFFYTYLAMNNRPDGQRRKALFDDVNVRRAVAMLVPYDELHGIVFKGINKRMSGPVSFLKREFNESLTPVPTDVDGAKKLLAAAGWIDTDQDGILEKKISGKQVPMMFELTYLSVQTEWKDIATIIADGLAKAGLKAELRALDYPVFISNNRQHDFDMTLGAWGASSAPEDFSQVWHTSAWESNGSNFAGFGDVDGDALIDSVKTTVEDSLRIELSKRFQRIVYDRQPIVFLFASVRRNIVHRRFGDVELYYERPGMLLNNFRLLSAGVAGTAQVSP